MGELIKNIGLGLFVNGTYAIMNSDLTITVALITIISILIMIMGNILQKENV